MTKHLLKYIFLFLLLTAAIPLRAEGWWEKMEFLKYTPRYFGANAFPIPEMMGADLGSESGSRSSWRISHNPQQQDKRPLCTSVYSNRKRASRIVGQRCGSGMV